MLSQDKTYNMFYGLAKYQRRTDEYEIVNYATIKQLRNIKSYSDDPQCIL